MEVFSIIAVHYKYKKHNIALSSLGFSSTYFIFNRALVKLNVLNEYNPLHDTLTSHPKPLLGPSSAHGYSNMPGTYILRHYDRYNKDVYAESKVTILDDGTRDVGASATMITDKVFVFGDSFVFGEGVSDEHTFTFLLQQQNRDKKFYLHAAGGWSLSNALVNIRKLKKEINKDDIIILGYADFYKLRHVAAPKRMKEYGNPRNILPNGLGHLKVSTDETFTNKIEIISLFCENLRSYCEQPNPSKEYMEKITRNIINEIASTLDARIILLHFYGDLTDPALDGLASNIEVVPATSSTFKYEIRDNILNLDGHPGPFWHYAMFSRLNKIINARVN
ncbi:hypothetical protein OAP28_02675 [Planktomarina sp.]|nr:hypothetical protein [Planktomarina sp.]